MEHHPAIFMIDNFDSFTFNLVQYVEELGAHVTVLRNNGPVLESIQSLQPDAIVISPGPGRPENAGCAMDVVRQYSGKIPILGVCLGHQCIASVFGAAIVRAARPMHGKTSDITGDGKGVFGGISKPFRAMRYHSLVAEEKSLPHTLEVSARSEDGEIMGIRHKDHPTEGIQFHPESIMTPMGKRILRNFVERI
ncbi:aminodeoxychorismate/anthranilate synthase component II [Desulfosarcina sp. OttesenSCG-928-A07]|nr:aminodeoxychorismate/anthranilate synthase component II [Desulfosarcina sp. OttesenSCG-928-A07]